MYFFMVLAGTVSPFILVARFSVLLMFCLFSLPRTEDSTHKERVHFIVSLNNVTSDVFPASAGCLCDEAGVLVARINPTL